MTSNLVSKKDDVSSLVREQLNEYLLKNEGQTLGHLEVIHRILRPYSEISILSARTDSSDYRFILKRILSHPLNSSTVAECEQALVEYETLSWLFPRFAKEEHYRVPRPVAVLTELNALLMEFVEGHELVDDLRFVHYFSNQSRFKKLQEDFFRLGSWLRRLFEISGRRFENISAIESILLFCHDRLSLIDESRNSRCPVGFGKRVAAFLDNQAQQLQDLQIPVTGQHRDFGPWNILTGPCGITVIDFFGFCDGPIPVSILSVLVWLESIGHGIANNPHRLKLLRERFLAGLGSCPGIPNPLILLCEAHQRIIQIAGAIIAKEGHIFNRFERFASVKTHVQWLLHPPERSLLYP